MTRSDAMQAFLVAAEHALTRVDGPGAELARALPPRWKSEAAQSATAPTTLPVCNWITTALANNNSALAAAFAALAPELCWQRRPNADPADKRFWDGHANAVILGPGGREDRSDLWIGATIMAPDVDYPDHSHPPAEVYLPLTAGEWWNAGMDWADPGLDGFIYNPPAILHAMRSGASPMLALWFLPL